VNPRRARADDAPELVRLRRVMFAALGPVSEGPWVEQCTDIFAHRLTDDPTMAAYVIDDGTGRLLSCAVGEYERRLPGPRSSAGHVGHVRSVVTDPAHRRKGCARACVAALLDWLAGQDCSQVQLRASAEGQHVYAGLGFEVMPDVFMSWRPAACPLGEAVKESRSG
jgi:GNAT superfamily N-acetyltransferase